LHRYIKETVLVVKKPIRGNSKKKKEIPD